MSMLPADHLFTLRLDIASAHDLGMTPHGHQRFAGIAGGTFEGDRLRGRVLEGGTDWIAVRPDDIRQVDVRLLLKTHDDAVITLRYEGYRLAKTIEHEGEQVHAYRVAALFEASDPRYVWLNGFVAVGLGTRHPPAGPVYEFHSIR